MFIGARDFGVIWYLPYLILSLLLVTFGMMLRHYLCRRTRPVSILIDASTQTENYIDMSNEELNTFIGRRLGNMSFPLLWDQDVMLRDNYHLRLEYKSAGAFYDGTIRRLQFRAGSDLRALL